MTIDISPEAVERLASDCAELGYRSCAALSAATAETAAAYEVAAQYLENPKHQGIRPAWGMDIRALTPADSKAALDRMLADALRPYQEALIFCSGSADFQEGGIAREGWKKLCAALINSHPERNTP